MNSMAKLHKDLRKSVVELKCYYIWYNFKDVLNQGSKLRGAEGQNAPKLSPNAPRLLNLGAKFCYPIQPDMCFEA